MGKFNIHRILTEGMQQFKGHPYIFERNGDAFEARTYDIFAQDVWNTAAALLAHGLQGRNIILYSGNSYNYMVADLAVMGYVGVSCTISKEWRSRDLCNAAELLDAGAVIYLREKTAEINELRECCPQLLYIVMEDLPEFADINGQAPEPQSDDACCKIIFSSGTTGVPKAVMLSQRNMFANWESLRLRTPFTTQDRDYLFLPLSHTYGGICNFLYSLITGMRIYVCSDTRRIMEELQMVKPTVFCAVPLIFEKLYAACTEGNIPPAMALGGNIRYLFSGGAYLKREIREFLKNAGLNLLEAYGLTETSSLISCEYSDAEDFDSVGTIMETVQVGIAQPDEDGIGEIIVRGDNLFSGYYNNPAATAAAFDSDGFFHTGDLGYIKGEKLYVAGRKRRMILCSNGENVFPDEIESLFMAYPQLSRVMVYERDGRIAAFLYAVSECDGGRIVAEVNDALPRFAKIQDHEVILDGIDTRLK